MLRNGMAVEEFFFLAAESGMRQCPGIGMQSC
jgi:hypothetical protein